MGLVSKNKLKFTFFLVILDYIFTFIGIQKGYILEGNPLLVSYMSLPFLQGLLIKIGYTGILLSIIHKTRHKAILLYKWGSRIILGTMILLALYHFNIIATVSDALL